MFGKSRRHVPSSEGASSRDVECPGWKLGVSYQTPAGNLPRRAKTVRTSVESGVNSEGAHGAANPRAGAFDPNWMVIMLFIVVIGGVGTIEGPIIGTALYFLLRAWFAGTGNLYLLLLGAAAIAVMLIASKGIWGIVREKTGMDLLAVRRPSGMAGAGDKARIK